MRADWDEYFMSIANAVATRATCPRKSVGAVLVRARMILSTGYNGSIRGLPHCTDAGCMMEDGHCVATIHAEANAIIQAARNGVRIEGATCYVTASPCWNCFKVLVNAGVERIVYGEFYRDDRIFAIAKQLGIEMVGPVRVAPLAPAQNPVPRRDPLHWHGTFHTEGDRIVMKGRDEQYRCPKPALRPSVSETLVGYRYYFAPGNDAATVCGHCGCPIEEHGPDKEDQQGENND